MTDNTDVTPKKRPVMNGIETGVSFTKDNQPSPEAKKAGWAKKKALENLKQDMFDRLTELGAIDKGVDVVFEQITNGKVDKLIDLLKIITPKEVKQDIKTDGSMSPTIVINTNLKKQGE